MKKIFFVFFIILLICSCTNNIANNSLNIKNNYFKTNNYSVYLENGWELFDNSNNLNIFVNYNTVSSVSIQEFYDNIDNPIDLLNEFVKIKDNSLKYGSSWLDSIQVENGIYLNVSKTVNDEIVIFLNTNTNPKFLIILEGHKSNRYNCDYSFGNSVIFLKNIKFNNMNVLPKFIKISSFR